MNDKATLILNKLNEAADASEYGRYISKQEWVDITREVMFGKPQMQTETYWKTKKGSGRHYRGGLATRQCRVQRVAPEPMTADQEQKLLKLFNRMIDKGIIKLSKSGNMIKPMMTASEWVSKQK